MSVLPCRGKIHTFDYLGMENKEDSMDREKAHSIWQVIAAFCVTSPIYYARQVDQNANLFHTMGWVL